MNQAEWHLNKSHITTRSQQAGVVVYTVSIGAIDDDSSELVVLKDRRDRAIETQCMGFWVSKYSTTGPSATLPRCH
jgi:hypothetical protein